MVNEEYLNEFWFVDYCSNCKDLDIMSPNDIPCHHSWYCWHDNGECQEMEYQLGLLKEKEHWNGRLTPSERKQYNELKQKKYELVKRKVKEYRRKNK